MHQPWRFTAPISGSLPLLNDAIWPGCWAAGTKRTVVDGLRGSCSSKRRGQTSRSRPRDKTFCNVERPWRFCVAKAGAERRPRPALPPVSKSPGKQDGDAKRRYICRCRRRVVVFDVGSRKKRDQVLLIPERPDLPLEPVTVPVWALFSNTQSASQQPPTSRSLPGVPSIQSPHHRSLITPIVSLLFPPSRILCPAGLTLHGGRRTSSHLQSLQHSTTQHSLLALGSMLAVV
jgi:hypothetical protein